MRLDKNGTQWPSTVEECGGRTAVATWDEQKQEWHPLPAWRVRCGGCGDKYSRVTWRWVTVIEGEPQLECGSCGTLHNLWCDRPAD